MVDNELIELRHRLHKNPELSGNEKQTAGTIVEFLKKHEPDKIIRGIGGYGLAAIYDSGSSGASVLIRCDLDALPVNETIKLEYGSENRDIAHKCGHDGHMTIVSGLARHLYKNKPDSGKVVLLYQPAEETGKGALEVLNDDKFSQIEPDYVFALHNLPGFEKSQIICCEDVFASASKGFIIKLNGATSHAAEPNHGVSPAMAVSQIISAFNSIPQNFSGLHEAAQATVIHAKLGERAFGTSPGIATVMATLRAHRPEVIERIAEKCEHLAAGIAKTWELEYEISYDEEFPATVNDKAMTEVVRKSAQALNLKYQNLEIPFAWSEDFGNFTARYRGALFGLGAGKNTPALHHPKYDFPDEIIEDGINMFIQIIDRVLKGD